MLTRLDELKAKLNTDRKLAEITASFNGIHLHSVVPGISREERAEGVRYARRLVAEWRKAEETEGAESASAEPAELSRATATATDPAPPGTAATGPELTAPTIEPEETRQPELAPGSVDSDIEWPEAIEPPRGTPVTPSRELLTEPSPEAPVQAGVERRKTPRTPIESAARIERASRLASDVDDRLEPTIRTLDSIDPAEAEQAFATSKAIGQPETPPPTAYPTNEDKRSGTGISAISIVVLAAVLGVGAFMFRDRIPGLLTWIPALDQIGSESEESSAVSQTETESAAMGARSQGEGPATTIATGEQTASPDRASLNAESSERPDQRDEPGVPATSATGASDDATRADELETPTESTAQASATSMQSASEASEDSAEDNVAVAPAATMAQSDVATDAAAAEADQAKSEAPTVSIPEPSAGDRTRAKTTTQSNLESDMPEAAAATEDPPRTGSELTANTQVTAPEMPEESGGVTDAAGRPPSPSKQDSGTRPAEPGSDGDRMDETLAILTEDPPSVTEAASASDEEQATSGPQADEKVSGAQEHLERLGYDVGRVDGILGPRTRRAIRAFQRDIGVLPDGKITPELTATLAAAP